MARVAVARAGEVQELIPCTQRGGMCCRALPEGACVAWHLECFILCIAVSQGELIGDCSKELGKKAAERCKRTEKIRFRGVITAKPVLLREKGGGVWWTGSC